MDEEFEPNVGVSEVLGHHAANPKKPGVGVGTVFAFGSEWQVSGQEQRIKAQFERRIRTEALRGINQLTEDGANPDLVRQMMAAYTADLGAGAYNWDGAACRKARTDLPGLRYLFYLLLVRCHPNVSLETAIKIFRTEPEQCHAAMDAATGNWGSVGEEEPTDETTNKKAKKPSKKPVTMDEED